MTLDEILDQMLRADEGDKNTAYADPLTGGAPWTIGIGHTGPEVHAGLVWTDAQVEAAYDCDKLTAEARCIANFSPWYQALSPQRQAVLVSMVFQMGINRVLKFTNTLAAIKDQRFVDAADGMRNSLWGHQTPHRVIRMAEQMQLGVFNVA